MIEREELGKQNCPCCGKPVTIKVNKNGLAYFNCFNGLEGIEGYCGASRKWSKPGTASLRRKFERETPQNEFKARKAEALASSEPSFLGN